MRLLGLRAIWAQLLLGIAFCLLLPSSILAQETLESFAGESVELPESISAAEVTSASTNGAIKTGEIVLNGVNADVILYTPVDDNDQAADQPNLIILHQALNLLDYIPDLGGTAADELGNYKNAAFIFVAAENAGLLPNSTDETTLSAFLEDLDLLETVAGINFLATVDMADFDGGEQIISVLGSTSSELQVATMVPQTLFANVQPGGAPGPMLGADPGNRDIAEFRALYGDELFSTLSFAVNADQFTGSLGPLDLLSARWELMLSLPPESTDLSELAVVVGLRSNIEFSLDEAAGTLEAQNVLVEYDPQSRSFSLDGGLTAPEASLASLREQLDVPTLPLMDEFTLALSGFRGSLIHGELSLNSAPTIEDIESFELALTGSGSLNNSPVELELRQDLDVDDQVFIPTLFVSGGFNLSDLLGTNIPSLLDPALTQLVISRDYQTGQVQIDGSAVDVVRYRGPDDAYPVYGMKHVALDIGTYVPSVAGTPLGSFGLGNAAVYILPEELPEEAPQQLDFAGLCAMPESLRAVLLDTGEVEEIEANSLCDNPEANQETLNGMTVPGVFDLSLQAGVNVIGTYTPPSEGVASSIMAAFEIAEQGYTAKASFKVSDIKQPDLSKPRVSGVCGTITNFDPSGLDISFPISAYTPPGVNGAMEFNGATFSLKEVEGQLEPSIITGITLNFPDDVGNIPNVGSISQVALAAKLALTGDASVLCDGVQPEDNIGLQFAGSTALNLDQINGVAFNALQEVIQAPEEESGEEPEEETAQAEPGPECTVETEDGMPKLGWQRAFGIPFLTVNQFASAGVFKRNDDVISIDSTVWTESLLGSETLEMYGELNSVLAGSELETTDWAFTLPGPVKVGCMALPGLSKLPIISDLTVRDIELSSGEMLGTLDWDVNSDGQLVFNESEGDVRGRAWFEYEEMDGDLNFNLFASLSRFAVDMVWPRVMISEGSLSSATQQLGPVLIGWRDDARQETRLGDLPQPLQDMLLDGNPDQAPMGFAKFLDEDSSVSLAQGLTVIGRTNLPDVIDVSPLPGLLPFVEVSDPDVLITGAFNVATDSNEVEGDASLTIAELQTQGVPGDLLTFQNARTQVGQEGNDVMFGFDSDAIVNFPWPLPQGSTTLKMNGATEITIDQRRTDVYDLGVELSSTGAWNEPFGIPANFSGISLQAQLEHQPGLDVLKLKACGVADLEITATPDIEGCIACTITNGEVSGCDPSESDSVVSLEFEPPVVLSEIVDGAGNTASNLFGELIAEAAGVPHGSNPAIPNWPSQLLDASVSRLYLSDTTFAFDGSVEIGGLPIEGRFVLVKDGEQEALMVRLDESVSLTGNLAQRLTLADFLPSPLSGAFTLPPFAPLAATHIPEGVFIFSTQAVDRFSLEGIPGVIFDELFEGFIDDKTQTKLQVADGVTFVTRTKPNIFPAPVRSILSSPFGLDMDEEFLIGGSVGGLFGGEPSIAMYLELEGVTPDLPEHVRAFLEPKDSDITLFVRTANQGAEVDVGLSAEALLKARRLDTGELQGVVDEEGVFTDGLPTELSLAYTLNGTNPSPQIKVSAKVQGIWDEPLGLEGYSLTDAEVAFGVTGTGTSVAIHTERAEFEDKAFVFDLDTTWVGTAPTSLSGQFGRICPDEPEPCPDLELKPTILLSMQKSFFDLAFSAGSNLSAKVINQLPSEAMEVFNAFRETVDTVGDGAETLARNSPLSWVGLRNPDFYFGTPGSTPPKREGVERPPFGLGFRVGGELFLDVGSIDADIADGIYGLDLSRGFYLSGSVTTPAEFGDNSFTLTGGQRLPGIPALLELSGRLEFPGASLIPGVPALAEGKFAFERSDFTSADTNVSAEISLAGGLIAREASLIVRGRSIEIQSSPAECVDVPVELNGTLDLDQPIDPAIIAGLASRFAFPVDPENILSCASNGLAVAWNAALDAAETIANDPAAAPLAAQAAIANGARTVANLLPDGTPGKEELLDAIDLADDTFNTGGEFVLNTANEIPGFGTLNSLVGDGLGLGVDGLNEAAGLAGQGFQVVNNIAGSVVGLLGPVGGVLADGVGTATSVLTSLATETASAILSGDVSAIGNVAIGRLTSVTSSISCMFSSCSSPPPTYAEHPQACGDDQYWNPVFSNCFNRNAMVFMYTARDNGDGKTRCMADVNDEARVEVCNGRDRQQFLLDMESQQIRTVSYRWNQFSSRFDSGPVKCLTVYKEEGDRFFREEFKNCGGEYQARQRFTYTDNGKLINDASGLCLYWPGARSNDQTDVVTLACSSISVAQGKLEWTGSALAADFARNYLHPYQGKLKMGGQCINQRGLVVQPPVAFFPAIISQVMEQTSFQETLSGNCDNWRFNYIDPGIVQVVLPSNTGGTGLCLTYGNNVVDPNARVISQNCDPINKNQRFRVHYINGANGLGFNAQDAGRGLRERRFVLRQAANPETGNNGSWCLAKDISGNLVTRAEQNCYSANANNTFTFEPSDAALSSVVRDFDERRASELLTQQLEVISSGQLNAAFSGLVFAQHDMCINGEFAVGGNCYPSPLSIGDSEHPNIEVRRVYRRIQGRDFCLTVDADNTMSYQRCASGRTDQLWLQQSFSADANAFVLMNVQRQQCLQPQATSGRAPLVLADCGSTQQVIRYSLPLKQGADWLPPVLGEVLESGEEFQQARNAFFIGFSRTVAMQLQLGSESQNSANRCLRLEKGNFFETLGDVVLQAGGCENQYFGTYNEETSIRLWPVPEEGLSGFRVHLDLNNSCLAIPRGAKFDDASLVLSTEACETNKSEQIWSKLPIVDSSKFRLCTLVESDDGSTSFCLSSDYSKLFATPQDNSDMTQELQLIGPWSIRDESELILVPEGGIGDTSVQPPILPEFSYQAEFAEFTQYQNGNEVQTSGYGNLVIDIDLASEGQEQYCLHASSDPLTFTNGLRWSDSSSVPEGLTLTVNGNDEEVVLENIRYNATLRLCGSSRSDGQISGAEVAIYESERSSAKRIHWRDENLCLTKPSSNTGFAYFDRCIYGLQAQSWSSNHIRDLTIVPDSGLNLLSQEGGAIYNLPYTNEFGVDENTITIRASFMQSTGALGSELEMYYNPIPGMVLPTDQDDDVLNQGFSDVHATQLILGISPNQRCIALDETAPADAKVRVQQCQSTSDNELLANNAFTRYQAEASGQYRILSELTGECLTLPLFENSSGEIALELSQDPDVAAFCRESEESPFDLFDQNRTILNRSSGERYPFRQLSSLAINLEAPFTRQQLCDEYVRVNGGFQSFDESDVIVRRFCEDKLQSFDDVFEQSSGLKVFGRPSREGIPLVMESFIPVGDSQPQHTRREICDFYSLDIPVLTTSCQVGQPGQLWSRQAEPDDQFYIQVLGQDYCIEEVPSGGVTQSLARARKCDEASGITFLRSHGPVVVNANNNIESGTGLTGAVSNRLDEMAVELQNLQRQFDDGEQQDTGDLEDRRASIAETSAMLLQRTDNLVVAAQELNTLVETPGIILAQARLKEGELAALLDLRLNSSSYDPSIEQQIRALEDEIAQLYQQANNAGSLPGLLYDRAEDILRLTQSEIAKSQALKSELEAAVVALDGLIQEQQEIDQIIMRDLDSLTLSMQSGDLAIDLMDLKVAINDAIAALDFTISGYENIAILESQFSLTLIARVFNATGDTYSSFDEGLFTELIVEWRDAIAQAEDTREQQLLDRQQLDDGNLEGRYSRIVFTTNECIRTNRDAAHCALLSISDSESVDPLDKRVHVLGDDEFIDACLTLNQSLQTAGFERCSRERQDQWWQTINGEDGTFALQATNRDLCLQLDPDPNNLLNVVACGSDDQRLRLVPPISFEPRPDIPDVQSGENFIAYSNLLAAGGSNAISIQLRIEEEGETQSSAQRCLAAANESSDTELAVQDCANGLLVNYPVEQSFRLLSGSWESAEVVRLYVDLDGSCLDLSTPDGSQANLSTATCRYGRSDQWWTREAVSNNTFRLRSAGGLSDQCLTAAGDSITTAVCGESGQLMTINTPWNFDSDALDSLSVLAASVANTAPTGSVTISGDTVERAVLQASNDLQDADGLGLITYQWRRDGINIQGASIESYQLVQADVGKTISVQARYFDGSGNLETVLSAPTSVVTNVSNMPTGSVTITGTPAVEETLLGAFDLQDFDGLGDFFYQWQRNGMDIPGAISIEYTVQLADLGSRLTFVVGYEDGEGDLELTPSAPSDIVFIINLAPTGTVMVAGAMTVGETLSATNTLSDMNGLGRIRYQWQRNGQNISGAVGSRYTLGLDDLGQLITVVATYRDGAGYIEQVSSDARGIRVARVSANDTDGDGVADSIDNCLAVRNADQTDFEGDGVGDACEIDTDNDGMPDDWEIENQLNPNSSWDRNADPDGDGFDNITEYELGSDPQRADTDNNNNGIPDSVESAQRLVPIINLLLDNDA